MTTDILRDVKPDQIWKTLSDAAEHWGKRRQVAGLKRLRKMGYNEETELGHVLGRQTKQDRLLDPYCNLVDRLRNALLDKLRAETLVAVGYHTGDRPDIPRCRIDSGHWRVLEPNFSENSARGGSLELFDILVTTPEQTSPSTSIVPTLTLSDNAKTARTNHGQTKLAPVQYKLLEFLVQRVQAGKPLVSQKEVLAFLYSADASPDNVRSQVFKLREKLRPLCGENSGDQTLIETRPGLGYALRLSPDQVRIE